jgi:membrane protein
VATILWIVASIGFAVYVANFNSYDKTYGSPGGVIILLTWLYLSAPMVLVGAVMPSPAHFCGSGAAAAGVGGRCSACSDDSGASGAAPLLKPQPE